MVTAVNTQETDIFNFKPAQRLSRFLIFCTITRDFYIEYNTLQKQGEKKIEKLVNYMKGEMCAVTKVAY